MMPKAADVPHYIANFPPRTRKLLRQMRALVRKVAPKAEERISYGIAGYHYHGMYAHFAGYSGHIGFYPGRAALIKFAPRLKSYKTARGTVQFPLDLPLPASLIKEVLVWLRKEREATLRQAQGKRSGLRSMIASNSPRSLRRKTGPHK